MPSGLDPDDSVDERIGGLGSGPRSEAYEQTMSTTAARQTGRLPTCELVVAPVTSAASDVLVSRAALIDDEVRVPTVGGKERREVANIDELVIAKLLLVAETVVVAERRAPVSMEFFTLNYIHSANNLRDVGGNTTNSRVRVDLLGEGNDLSEDIGCRADVRLPAEPASVCTVKVDGNVRELEMGNGITKRAFLGVCALCALGVGL